MASINSCMTSALRLGFSKMKLDLQKLRFINVFSSAYKSIGIFRQNLDCPSVTFFSQFFAKAKILAHWWSSQNTDGNLLSRYVPPLSARIIPVSSGLQSCKIVDIKRLSHSLFECEFLKLLVCKVWLANLSLHLGRLGVSHLKKKIHGRKSFCSSRHALNPGQI